MEIVSDSNYIGNAFHRQTSVLINTFYYDNIMQMWLCLICHKISDVLTNGDQTNRRNLPIFNCFLLSKLLIYRKLELSECNSSFRHFNLSRKSRSLLLLVNICYYFIIQLSTICVTLVLTSLQGLIWVVMLSRAKLDTIW